MGYNSIITYSIVNKPIMSRFRVSFLFWIWIFFYPIAYCQNSNYNYIKATNLLDTTSNVNHINSMGDGQKIDVIQYFDGLGRLIQTNTYHASPTYKDNVLHTEYDSLGRQVFDYLPFPNNANGAFLADAGDLTMNYYSNPGDATIPSTAYPFGEKQFDDSPLNRVMKQGFPDTSWQLNGHPQEFQYQSNSTYDAVRLFEYNESTHQFSTNSYFNENSLFVEATYDENGNLSKIFKDKSGNVTLKESNLSGTLLRTYYIYNVHNNLAVVIQPEGSSLLTSSFTSSSQFIDRWCFTYSYDDRNRLIEKHIPGMAKPVCMVYDSLDQLVLTQDGNLNSSDLYCHQWYFTKYDVHGRPVLEGLYRNRADTTREDIQQTADAYISQHSYYETRSSTQYSTRQGYTNDAFPPIDSCEILKVYYYDDYDFNYNGQPDYSYRAFANFGDQDTLSKPKGMLTGTKTKILIEQILQDPYLFTVNFYDSTSRVVQQQSRNHSGHFDTLTTKYNFIGDAILTRFSHASTCEYHVLYDSLIYDHMRRLKEVHEKIDRQAWIQVSALNYNELGQLIEKNLHKTGTSTYLQSLDYSYNARGWLTGINLRSNGNDTRDLYFQQLLYDKAVSTLESSPQYNGNISTDIWWHYGNSSHKGYGYTYDNNNRLTKAIYGYSTSNNWTKNNYYSLPFLEYDKNGNITRLRRNTLLGGTYNIMDDLYYYYEGNQMTYVDDYVATYYGFQDNGHYHSSGNQEYIYDNNGNLTKDLNKGITSIIYNNLNLPVKIEFENSKKITYLYDANGTKLRKCYYEDGNLMETTDYYGMFVCKDDHIDYILTSEGRLKYNDHNFQFYEEYFIKDHLGNVRDVITTDPAYTNNNTQITDYYPFGLEIPVSGTSDNQYKYNGKEYQDEAKLNWLDYGARFYDPVIGRWHAVDPLAEKHFEYTPFAYVFNNPILLIDPFGLDSTYYNEAGTQLYQTTGDGGQSNCNYVIKTSRTTDEVYNENEDNDPQKGTSNPISVESALNTENQILNGNLSGEHMSNVVKLNNNATMEAMVKIVSQDDGSGGTSDANNREYSGKISNGTVVEGTPGPVNDPSKGIMATSSLAVGPNEITFDSHPSGSKGNFIWAQPPSQQDINNCTARINYTFGMRTNTIYVYNSSGVIATLPIKVFKK
jgi:RHS repeat-associated protein